ncbi:MAG TPA: rubrerythrin family protein [Synergistaceae bacterium]|jgi:VIT1/CCC1 family predicted Fe2+/Mn2+ transporter|nr:rubrerythrin family protein [Synergistaceae bacterium]
MKQETLDMIRRMQMNEATEHVVYGILARSAKGHNGEVLAKISAEEEKHSAIWGKYTGVVPKPGKLNILYYRMLAFIFGLTFVINLMEAGEEKAQDVYADMTSEVPEALAVYKEEQEHEAALIDMIDEERLKYISSMVLGLNDALVEITGALAGFTFALGDSRTICMAGFITGSAATLSMAASEYLSRKNDPGERHPLKASFYTGMTYMLVVTILLLPYFFIASPVIALVLCLFDAGLVIFIFTFYVSVVRREPFQPAFLEMIFISFGVAALSFCIGWIARVTLGIQM